MTSEKHLDALLREAKNSPVPLPSTDLFARVLADAAENLPAQPAAPVAQAKPGLLARLLAPVGGFGGAMALAGCAAFGVVAGAGFTDTLFEIPGLDTVLANLTVDMDSTSPYESLTMIMSES